VVRGITIALLPLVLAACHSSALRFTGRDAEPDPGVEPDAATDSPSPDLPAEPDAGPPDVHEEPHCDSITGGACSLVEQCGCERGSRCDLGVDGDTCEIVEHCMPGTGRTDVEEECFTGEECLAGTICLTRLIDGRSYCYEWCRDDGDCSVPGRECAITITIELPAPCTGIVTLPHRVCTIACPPDENYDLFATGPDPAICPPGLVCAWDTIVTGGGCDVARCVPEGTGYPGDDCAGGRGCHGGSGCYGSVVDGFYCRTYCDDLHPCTTGTCTSYGSPVRPDLGVCLP
jgi:hypothetical protein